MRISELVRIDSRGRVIIPLAIRDVFSLQQGMYVMLVGDVENREVKLIPFADPDAHLIEIHLTLADKPGALAQAATKMASIGIDLLSTQSRTLHRGEVAEWQAIVDISKCKYKAAELKHKLAEEGGIKKVEIMEYR